MAITVRDIAKLAGVSPAAVSLVINNKKGVSDTTRKRVQDILVVHQYKLLSARPRERGFRLEVIKHRAHGMAVEENQGFIASIIDQVEQECGRLSIRVSERNCNTLNAADSFARINLDPPDGIILVGTELSAADYHLLDILKAPLVVLDNSMRDEKWDSVVMDNRQITRTAVQYLYDMGHREIGYFKSNRQISNLDERYEGYQQALRELGLKAAETTLLTTTLNGAYRDMKRLIESGQYHPRGAAVADNDSIAIGAINAIQEAGYSVPANLSVIGVDDIPFSAVMSPALSTMRISRAALGSLAVEMIRKRVQHPDWPAVRLKIAGTLIKRGSVTPFKGKEG